MKFERVYDIYGRLQCRSCEIFYDQACYYQHNAPMGRFRNVADNVCKLCQRRSAVADASRKNARAEYANDPAHRARQIANAKKRYWTNREAINTSKRAICIAKKYA